MKQYGVYGMHIEPTRRQRIFGEVKEKAQKCKDTTQLCAAIYPWILALVHKYKDSPFSPRNMDSFQNELNDFKCSLSIFLSDRLRNGALDSAVDTALEIAREDVCQISINLSAIMAHFVDEI